ncbi:MAG: efflux RND transporter permease subunit [Clostridia bacterium]|jgi:HAE1 family hydrophobic/amphiphilic exporter-1|nr:efflux RND transporter permease subunit [Clostridia bacterium]
MLSKFSIKRPVTVIMVTLMVILAGLLSLSTLKLNLMPDIDIPVVLVSTTYVGAGPEEIENLISKPIEEALGTVSNVDTVSSTSSSNSSMVIVKFLDGTDINVAADDVREKIDLVKSTLPDDANDPMVLKIDINELSSIIVGVGSDKMDIPDLTQFVDDNITDSIEKIDGVASVDAMGGLDNVVNITLDTDKMNGYGISTSQISSMLKAENINSPVGKLTNGTTKITARTVGEFKSVDDIKNILLTTSGGSKVRLSDVADVEYTTEDENSYAIVDGEKSIVLAISKQSDANTVEISDRVSKEMEQLNSKYPQIHMSMLSNTSDYIKTSVKNVLSTALQAAIMAVIVLFIFLRSGKTSAIIAVSIPTSVVATFALMYVSGMTLNIISLGGITIGIGMLVDNSVVVLENITKFHSKGIPADEAADRGANEVGVAVMASTFTTVAVFLPLMFVKGTIGQMFKDLSLTVCFALLASLIVSLTFVPMAYSRLLRSEEESASKPKKNTPLNKLLDSCGKGLGKLDMFYRKVLAAALCNKKKIIVLVFALFVLSFGLIPLTGVNLLPDMDEGAAAINIDMPNGTDIDETSKVLDEVLKKIKDIPETKSYYVMAGATTASLLTGGSQTDTASINLTFCDKKDRDRSTNDIVDDIKNRIKTIPGADITVTASSSAMGSDYESSSDVEIQLNDDNTDELRSVGKDIEKLVSSQSWTKDVVNSSEDSEIEANIVINREKAAKYGVTTSTIASTLATAINGSTATEYKVNDDEMDIIIKDDKDKVSTMNDLQKVTISTSSGIIPITDVVDIQTDESATSITRKNNHTYITIGANLKNGMTAGNAQKELTKILDGYKFPENCSYEFTGDLDTMKDTFKSLGIALVVAMLLVYMIMASQFESFIYPLIVMFSVPLGITGAILGLFVCRQTITATSFMAFIMLVGMVVNNAIILIDYTNQLRARGMECNEALLEAGPSRLRPILMTTLTTVIGMVPMALALGEGTEMQRPMGVAIIFGLSISTLITLIFIPVLYSSVEVFRIHKHKKSFKKQAKKLETEAERNTNN